VPVGEVHPDPGGVAGRGRRAARGPRRRRAAGRSSGSAPAPPCSSWRAADLAAFRSRRKMIAVRSPAHTRRRRPRTLSTSAVGSSSATDDLNIDHAVRGKPGNHVEPAWSILVVGIPNSSPSSRPICRNSSGHRCSYGTTCGRDIVATPASEAAPNPLVNRGVTPILFVGAAYVSPVTGFWKRF
jgi:hypothetical protein